MLKKFCNSELEINNLLPPLLLPLQFNRADLPLKLCWYILFCWRGQKQTKRHCWFFGLRDSLTTFFISRFLFLFACLCSCYCLSLSFSVFPRPCTVPGFVHLLHTPILVFVPVHISIQRFFIFLIVSCSPLWLSVARGRLTTKAVTKYFRLIRIHSALQRLDSQLVYIWMHTFICICLLERNLQCIALFIGTS